MKITDRDRWWVIAYAFSHNHQVFTIVYKVTSSCLLANLHIMQPLVFVRRVATFYIGGSSVIIFKGTCLGNSCHVDVGRGSELHRQFLKRLKLPGKICEKFWGLWLKFANYWILNSLRVNLNSSPSLNWICNLSCCSWESWVWVWGVWSFGTPKELIVLNTFKYK